MSENQLPNHSASFAIIPSYIMDDNDLEEGAKMLYARISMYSSEGRCWASNEHFAEKQGVTTRCIQNWLKQLKDKKYILVEVTTVALRQTQRNIWLSEDFKNKFKQRTTVHPPMKCSSPPPEPQFTHIRTRDKEDKYKQQQNKVADAPVVVSSSQEKREKDADEAATQYINSEIKKGNRVNETRIRKQALKEGWKPNTETSSRSMAKIFKNKGTYKGIHGTIFECYLSEKRISFLNLNHPSFQPVGLDLNCDTFRDDFIKLLDRLDLLWVIENKGNS